MMLDELLRTEVAPKLSNFLEEKGIKEYSIVTIGSYGTRFYNDNSDIDIAILLREEDYSKASQDEELRERINEYISQRTTKNIIHVYFNNVDTYLPEKKLEQTIVVGKDSWYSLAQTPYLYYVKNTAKILVERGIDLQKILKNYFEKNTIMSSGPWEGYEMHIIALTDLIKALAKNNTSAAAKAVYREIYASMIAQESLLLSGYEDIQKNAKRVFRPKCLHEYEGRLISWMIAAKEGKEKEISDEIKRGIFALFNHSSKYFSNNITSFEYFLKDYNKVLDAIANKIFESIEYIKNSDSWQEFVGYLSKEYVDTLLNLYITKEIAKEKNSADIEKIEQKFKSLYDIKGYGTNDLLKEINKVFDDDKLKSVLKEVSDIKETDFLTYAKIKFLLNNKDYILEDEKKKLEDILKEIDKRNLIEPSKSLAERTYNSQLFFVSGLIYRLLNNKEKIDDQRYQKYFLRALEENPFNKTALAFIEAFSENEEDKNFIHKYLEFLEKGKYDFQLELSNSIYKNLIYKSVSDFVKTRIEEVEEYINQSIINIESKESIENIGSIELIELATQKYILSNCREFKRFLDEAKELLSQQKTIMSKVTIYNKINHTYLNIIKKNLDLDINRHNSMQFIYYYSNPDGDEEKEIDLLIRWGMWELLQKEIDALHLEAKRLKKKDLKKSEKAQKKAESLIKKMEEFKRKHAQDIQDLREEIKKIYKNIVGVSQNAK